MTAALARSQNSGLGHEADRLCQTAVAGRHALRALARLSAPLQLSEAELQILWGLRTARGQGIDQTTLAAQLALSQALVSASVERLRQRRLIAHQQTDGDRRRRLWQLSADGWHVLQQFLIAADESREAAA